MVKKEKNPLLLGMAAVAIEKAVEKGIQAIISSTSAKKKKSANIISTAVASNPYTGKTSRMKSASSKVVSRPNMAPVAMGYSQVTKQPVFTSTKNGNKRVVFTEQIASSISGASDGSFSVAFNANINPGNSTLFPWFAKQAILYEQYRINKFSVQYVPINATSAVGDVLIVPEYDPLATLPATSNQAMDKVGSSSSPVWMAACVDYSASLMQPFGGFKYVRDGFVAGDLKTYDCGQVIVAFENLANTNKNGKLLVSYDIELRTPLLEPSVLTPTATSRFYTTASTSLTSGSNVAILNWAPETYNGITLDAFGLAAFRSLTNSQFTLPRGVWRVRWSLLCNSANAQVIETCVISTTYPGGMGYFQNDLAATDYINVDGSAIITSNGSEAFNIVGYANAAGTTVIGGTLHSQSTYLEFTLA